MNVAKEEPVVVGLGSLAGVVDAGLLVSNSLGWTQLDGNQLGLIIGFVTVACGAVAKVLRSAVTSPATIARAAGS